MSADLVWSVIRNNSSQLVKRNDIAFSTRSVSGTHRRYTHNFGRNKTADVVNTKAGVKLVVNVDGKKKSTLLNRKTAAKTIYTELNGVNNSIINKVTRKARYLKRSRAYKRRANRKVVA